MPNDLSKLNLGDGGGDRNLKDKALQDGLGADMDYTGFDGPASTSDTPQVGDVWIYDATNRIWKPGNVSASAVTYDNSDSGLNSTYVQAAIDEVNTEVGKTYKTSDSSSTTVNTTDYVPMSTSANAKKKVTWSTLLSKIKAAVTGATVKTSVAKTGSGSTVTTSIAADTSMDNVVGTLLNNDVALKNMIVVQNDNFTVTVAANGTINGSKSYSKSGYTPIFCVLTTGAWSDNCQALNQSWSKNSGSASLSYIMISKYSAQMTVSFDVQILWKKD